MCILNLSEEEKNYIEGENKQTCLELSQLPFFGYVCFCPLLLCIVIKGLLYKEKKRRRSECFSFTHLLLRKTFKVHC